VSSQDGLFYEDWRDSIRHLVRALGGPKKVGAMLRPAMNLASAANWVNDCLNPDRDSNFDFEEIVKILRVGREAGIHCAIYQLCDELLYARPPIVAPKSPLEEKAERLQKLATEFGRLAAEVAAETRNPLKAVS
jgi:hypothetical protein